MKFILAENLSEPVNFPFGGGAGGCPAPPTGMYIFLFFSYLYLFLFFPNAFRPPDVHRTTGVKYEAMRSSIVHTERSVRPPCKG